MRTNVLHARRPLRLAAVAVTAAAALTLSACGNNDDSSGTDQSGAAVASSPSSMGMDHSTMGSAAPAGAAMSAEELDKAFLNGMVPHHSAALEMAKVEVAKGTSAQVKALAQKIIAAQDKEIATMDQIATTSFGFTPMREHTGPMGEMMGVPMTMDMSMMATEVEQAANTDEMFLMMMIPHHASAIGMADEERMNGGNAQLKALAEKIIADQAKEIGEMQTLLATV